MIFFKLFIPQFWPKLNFTVDILTLGVVSAELSIYNILQLVLNKRCLFHLLTDFTFGKSVFGRFR